MLDLNKIYFEDCLIGMEKIDDKSIDMILCDLPYGTTACKWDVVIPFEPLWKQYKRIIKDIGAIVLTGSQPFTSILVMSNIEWFKYEIIWDKVVPSNFQLANYQPMKSHENVLVFSKSPAVFTKKNAPMQYHPIMTDANPENIRPLIDRESGQNMVRIRSKKLVNKSNPNKRFPKSIIQFNKYSGDCNPTKRSHPTQKPSELYEYLIKTYTQENELVLDNCMGSGTTAIACLNTNRNFIGFENDEKYYQIALERVHKREIL